jgi:pimeloyl-ACP methyl ester carboxylesterase
MIHNRLSAALGAAVVCAVVACLTPTSQVRVVAATARSADGVPIAYDVRGLGQATLIFVHGWSCDRTSWSSQVDAFASDYRVVALDLAGHGASGRSRTTWSIANFANDVVAVIDALDVRNVILVGHSLGGPVALEAALLRPDRVTAVVGVDTFLDRWTSPLFAEAIEGMRRDFPAGVRAFVRQSLFLPSSSPALVASISEKMAAAPAAVALPTIQELPRWGRDRQDAAVAALKAPIGLIMGRNAPAPSGFQRARGVAPLIVESVPDVGHFVMVEAPEVFNARLRILLSRLHRGA